MHTPSIKEESMTTVILRCFALVCVMLAIYYFAKVMLGSGRMLDTPAVVNASANLSRAFGAAVSAVSFWWMACVLSLLTRIANNGEKAVQQPAPRVSTAMETPARPKPVVRADDDGTAKYEL